MLPRELFQKENNSVETYSRTEVSRHWAPKPRPPSQRGNQTLRVSMEERNTTYEIFLQNKNQLEAEFST